MNSPLRVCAHCQKEAGLKAQLNETHGICRRHYVEQMTAGGFSEEFIAGRLASRPNAAFCPDLNEQFVAA